MSRFFEAIASRHIEHGGGFPSREAALLGCAQCDPAEADDNALGVHKLAREVATRKLPKRNEGTR